MSERLPDRINKLQRRVISKMLGANVGPEFNRLSTRDRISEINRLVKRKQNMDLVRLAIDRQHNTAQMPNPEEYSKARRLLRINRLIVIGYSLTVMGELIPQQANALSESPIFPYLVGASVLGMGMSVVRTSICAGRCDDYATGKKR